MLRLFLRSILMLMAVISTAANANVAPTVTLAQPSAFPSGSFIQLTASASDTDGTVASVQFVYVDAAGNHTTKATDTTAPYSALNIGSDQYQYNGWQAGSYTFVAVATDNQGATTESAPVTVIVSAAPTVSITSPVNNAFVLPPTVTLTASAADTDGTISKVEFYNGATLVGTATGSPYTVNVNNVANGTYSYTAKATDNVGLASTSAAVTVKVDQPPTVTLAQPSSFPSGSYIQLTASASDADGTVASVQFVYVDAAGNHITKATDTTAPYSALNIGSDQYQYNGWPAGSYTFVAVATDNQGATTESAPVTVNVGNTAPTVNISAPATGAVYSAPATFTLSATAADSDGAISKVEFYNGATLLGTDTTSPYSWALSSVAAGSYSYTAKAYDNAGAVTTSSAVAVTVNVPPSVQMTAPQNGATYAAPASISLAAFAQDSDGTISKVEFYNGATLVGTAVLSQGTYTLALTNVAAGSYSYTAKAYDNSSGVTTSSAVAVTVAGNAPPTVNITAPATGAVYNAPATFTLSATAADSDGTISKVEFYSGATLLGTDTTSPYSWALSSVAAGSYSYTAKAYDNAGAVTTSSTVAVTVNAPPTASITAPTTGAVYNAPATFTLSATAADSDGTISKVEFYNGATLLGTDTTSPYSWALSSVAAGSYSYTAKAYDNAGAVTTSSTVAVTVNAPPTASITAPTTGAVYNAPATFTLSATAADSDGTISKVEFYNGATLLGTDTTSPYSWALSGVAAGSYSYTAKAYDNAGAVTTSSAVAVTVNALPTVSITAPATGASYAAPANFTISATAADSDGTISKVEFYDGGTLLGTDTTSPYSWALVSVAAGSYSYTAKAYDNNGAVTTSSAVAVTVSSNNPPTINITLPMSGTVYTAPGSFTLEASAADSDGTISKVEFYDGATLLGNVTASPYNWALTGVAAGSYSYSAKAYDNAGAVTTSAAVSVVVNAPPTISITAPSDATVYSAPASFTITAAAADSDGTVSRVEFYDGGGSLLGTDTIAPYSSALTNVGMGSYSYTAKVYDNNGAMTSSAPVTVTVNALPTVSMTAPVDGAKYSAPAGFTLSATAADSDGTISKVEFYNGTTLLGSAATSPYSWTLSGVGSGSYSYTAKAYDNHGAVTTSAPVTVSVNASPSVAITAPVSGVVYAAPAGYTLSATATDSDGSISKVEFYDGATLLGTVTGSPYNWTLTSVPSGSYSYTAKAYDNDGAVTTSAPVAVKVNTLPTVSITSPTDGSLVLVPPGFTLSATALDSDGAITKLELYQGTTLVGADATVPYSWTLSSPPPGSYSYTVKAYDNNGGVTTSSAVNVTVSADSPPSVSLDTPADGTAYTAPTSIKLSATASDSDGSVTRVEFYDGGTLLGAVTRPYTLSLNDVPSGSHTYMAKAYDNSGVATSSSVKTVTVNNPPSAAMTSPANGATYSALAAFTLSATASDLDGSVSKVEFYNGATWLGTATTSPYSWSVSGLAQGTYYFTAKAYDDKGATSTSAVTTVTVTGTGNAAPIVSIVPPAAFSPNSYITLTANASDDGSIAKVDFYYISSNGSHILKKTATASPYTVTSIGTDTYNNYPWPAGSYLFYAVATDNLGKTTESAPILVRVSAAPTVSLVSPANNSILSSSSLTLTASAADSDGIVSKVEFYNGATRLGQASASPFQLPVSNLSTDTYTFTAKATDDAGQVTTSSPITVKVDQSPLVSVEPPGAVAAGSRLTITVDAADSDGNGTISSVEIFGADAQGHVYSKGKLTAPDSTTPAYPAPYKYTLTNIGVDSYQYNGFPAGSYVYYAVATDSLGGRTVSPPILVNVGTNIPPTVSITAPTDGSTFGEPGSFTLAATASDTDGTIARVEFYDGSSLLGTVASAPYTLDLGGVTAGTHSYTARAYDNAKGGTISAAVGVTVVSNAPTVAITAPTGGSLFNEPGNFTLTAQATDNNGTITKVEFYNNGTLLGTDSDNTDSSYSWTLSGIAPGSYSYTAKAFDNDGNATVSAPVGVIINARPTVSVSADKPSYVAPATISLSADAVDSDGLIDRVEFYNGGTLLGTATASPYSASIGSVPAGSYSFTAIAYDNDGAARTSTPLPVTVAPNTPPTVTLVAPTTGSTLYAPANFTLMAKAEDIDGTISGVEFYQGGTLLGTATASPFSWPLSSVPAGSYSYTARAIDNGGDATTSAAVTVTVAGSIPAAPTAPSGSASKGHLTVVKDASGVSVLYYDVLGNTTQSDRLIDGSWYSTKSGYDAMGRTKTLTYPDSTALSYTYDSYGNLWTAGSYATFTPGNTTNGYNAAGEVGRITYGNGIITDHTYYPDSLRLQTQTTGTSGSLTSLQNLSYLYYSMGNINSITGTIYNAGSGAAVAVDQSFDYDALNRLTNATGPYGTQTFGYDEIGNMTSNSAVGSYGYDTSFPVVQQPHAVLSAGTNSYAYDANGNMESGAGRSMGYDFENRPTTVTSGGVTTVMQYDANGVRTKKKVGSAAATIYVSRLYECVAGGSCTKYVFAGDQRIALVAGTSTYYYHGDHLSSSSVVTDSAGVAVQSLTYQPYGATQLNAGGPDVHHKYTGQELDDSTGLYYYRARYYDPALARFIQPDPIAGDVSNPQTINAYSYVANNPTNNTDPTGKLISFWHDYIAREAALQVGFSPSEAYQRGQENVDVDFSNQRYMTQSSLPQYTWLHAMGGIDPATNQPQDLGVRVKNFADGITLAYQQHDYAAIAHAGVDFTAGGHAGFQTWNGGTTSIGIPSFDHIVADTFPSPQVVGAAIYNDTQVYAIDQCGGCVQNGGYLTFVDANSGGVLQVNYLTGSYGYMSGNGDYIHSPDYPGGVEPPSYTCATITACGGIGISDQIWGNQPNTGLSSGGGLSYQDQGQVDYSSLPPPF